MATHYVLCPCCGRNHCGESAFHGTIRLREEDPSTGKEECRICRITNAYRDYELRDFGKNHTDCRWLRPPRLGHYHRCIPGYGDAVDFDLPVHQWNCAGHSHCKHGNLGVVEERASTMLRSTYDKYIGTTNNCVCQPQISRCHLFIRN